MFLFKFEVVVGVKKSGLLFSVERLENVFFGFYDCFYVFLDGYLIILINGFVLVQKQVSFFFDEKEDNLLGIICLIVIVVIMLFNEFSVEDNKRGLLIIVQKKVQNIMEFFENLFRMFLFLLGYCVVFQVVKFDLLIKIYEISNCWKLVQV